MDMKEIKKKKLDRVEEVLKLRDDGLSFNEIGEKYGVSSGRVRQIFQEGKKLRAHREYKMLCKTSESPQEKEPCWDGELTVKEKNIISVFMKFDGGHISDFLKDDIEFFGRTMVSIKGRRFRLDVVNKIRKSMSVKEILLPKKAFTGKEISWYRKNLEAAGWTCIPPKGKSGELG